MWRAAVPGKRLVGSSKAVRGAGHMEQRLPGELMRKDGSRQEGLRVNNIGTCITFFSLVLIYYSYTDT